MTNVHDTVFKSVVPAEEVIGQEQETGSAPLNPRDIRARPLLGVHSSRLSNCQIKRVIPEQDTTSLQEIQNYSRTRMHCSGMSTAH